MELCKRAEDALELKSPPSSVAANKNQSIVCVKQKKKQLKATLMLLIVCVLQLIVELPGCFLDLLVLLAYAINFLIYCFMSKVFRNEFFAICKNKKK